MSTKRNRADGWLSIVILLFAAFMLFLWIPADTETGFIEKVRSQRIIGDALAPAVAGVVVALGGVMLLLQTLLGRSSGEHALSWTNLKFVVWLLAIVIVAFLLMRWAGPLITPLIIGGDVADSYRQLRDTVPWKYMGYLSGGVVLVFGLMTLIQRQFNWLNLLIAVLAVLALAFIYDLPFDNLLLPPNGDV